jgi:hypothetical protein
LSDTPLFLLNTVLFPDGLLPLRVFEQRYLEMAKACLRDQKPFGVCRIREGSEVGAPATHEDIGCLAHIKHWDMQQLGLLQIVAQGAGRFRVLERRVQADGLALATIEALPTKPTRRRRQASPRAGSCSSASPPSTASAFSPSPTASIPAPGSARASPKSCRSPVRSSSSCSSWTGRSAWPRYRD